MAAVQRSSAFGSLPFSGFYLNFLLCMTLCKEPRMKFRRIAPPGLSGAALLGNIGNEISDPLLDGKLC
jgi:hypothetical protein